MRTPRILLIDDDPYVTEIVATFLRKDAQYELLEENDSSSAAAVARKFRPDLAILDFDMPGKDGREVANEFRNDPLLKDVTLIFLSGQISAKEKGVRNGAVYLPKPFSLAALNQVLVIIFAGRETLAGNSSEKSKEEHSFAASPLYAQSGVDPCGPYPWQKVAFCGCLLSRESALHPTSSTL